ncbi:DUF5667 domain-containing protein [Streptomyces sp. SAJ15]|uniref:DUF5667 domain-containing protein n=1 Tax=Streptomyces sp. SAJ15 TaxID=2011095 RepID=UPI001187054B|nr:DUF5667 domain-containing protein [Streptomyces sp. SAJ15]TVL93507.1 hypothetical protein CD790_00060 [Streptomyces sp. SAJ15]
MIANVSAHRRANAFAQALDALEDRDADLQGATQAERPDNTSAESTECVRLLALASGLGGLPAPELDPEVRTTQRAQLIAAMETAFAEGGSRLPEQRAGRGAHRAKSLTRLRPRSRWTKGLAAGGLTVGVAAGALGGVAAASSDALPGDTLYGVKRGMEDFKLDMADGDEDRGRIYLDHASTRMSEARRLMERGRSGDLDHESLGEIRRALSGMRHDAAEGHRLLRRVYERDGDLDPIRALSSFAKSHREGWSQLREELPVQLWDVGDEVNSVLVAIDEQVRPLRSLLPPGPGVDSPAVEAEPGAGPPHSAPESGRAHQPPRPSAAASDDQRAGGGSEGGRTPASSPAASEQEKPRGGLLDGADDLLDPSREDGGGLLPTPSTSGGAVSGEGTPKPDITLPPLLPELLPDLGLSTEDSPS